MDKLKIIIYNPSSRVVSLAGGVRDHAFGVWEARSVSDLLKSGMFDRSNPTQYMLLLVFAEQPSQELSDLLGYMRKYKTSLPVWLVVPSADRLDTFVAACRGLYSRCFPEKDVYKVLREWLRKRNTGEPGMIITHPSAA